MLTKNCLNFIFGSHQRFTNCPWRLRVWSERGSGGVGQTTRPGNKKALLAPGSTFPSIWWPDPSSLPQLTPRAPSERKSATPELKTVCQSWKRKGAAKPKKVVFDTKCCRVLLWSIWFVRMGLVQPEAPLLAWDGYQCGTCGAEFKTEAELRSHRMSQHSTPSTNTQETAVGWGEFWQ